MKDLIELFLAFGAVTLNTFSLIFFAISLAMIKKQLKREKRWEKFQKFVSDVLTRRFGGGGESRRDKPKGEARA